MSHLSETLGVRKTLGKPLALIALVLSFPACAFAQQITPNNMYSWTLEHNSMLQSNLTNDMINLGGRPTSGSGDPICLPPFDLQRGPAGVIPPALQGDPRFQAYLHCRYGNVPITPAMANAAPLPVPPAAGAVPPSNRAGPQAGASAAPATKSGRHYSLKATDFVPAQGGHPGVDRQVAAMPLSPDERVRLVKNIDGTFNHFAKKYRANNIAVSFGVAYEIASLTLNGTRMSNADVQELIFEMNDAMAQSPQFTRMSNEEKQTNADTWIMEVAILNMLRNSGQKGDAQAGQQAVQLAQVVMRRLKSM
ncbi:MAG: DUF6683 family protein [Gammaproteobacteria bacterium]